MSQPTRPAAWAGSFYPGDRQALAQALQGYLADAREAVPAARYAAAAGDGALCPKMLLVPHAGFVYSGPVAARAYALLARWRERIRRVVLLGPAHRVALRGLAAPQALAFATPLGQVPVDRAALQSLRGLAQVVVSDAAHAQEHALEVQLPFLQAVLAPGFTLLPLVVGRAGDDEVAAVIERLWGGDETLILISSDLSHYQPYESAQATDRATVERVLQLDGALGHDQACGATPLRGALKVARRHGLQAELLDLRNSGDTAGDRARVVGYAAMAFHALAPGAPESRTAVSTPTGTDDAAEAPRSSANESDAASADATLGAALLARAHNAIAKVLGQARVPEPAHPALATPSATFVTLTRAGTLRGCIGTLQASRSLEAAVRHHALAAAFRDPRFEPLSVDEWPGLVIEVSVLEAPQPLPVSADEAATLERIEPGRDGVVLEWRGRNATFLPQVWEQLPERARFIAALKRKAGLAPDFWASDVKLARYRVRKFVGDPIVAGH